MPEPLTVDSFKPYLGQAFRAEGNAPELILSEIQEREPDDGARAAGFRAPFCLLFAGPKQPVMPQGLYRLQPAQGEAIDLFIVPIQTFAGDRQDYQAVFN